MSLNGAEASEVKKKKKKSHWVSVLKGKLGKVSPLFIDFRPKHKYFARGNEKIV